MNLTEVGDPADRFQQATRRIFDEHHRVQARDPHLYRRLVMLVSPEYFELPADFFVDKVVLDAGCGSNANASYGLLQHGARVCSADLGTAWMDCAAEKLREFGDRSELSAQDVLDLDFPDGSFDFVYCDGVLHHTTDPALGLAELARVTKPGGYTYATIMATGDGIVYEWINLLRRRYTENQAFRSSVDRLDGSVLRGFLERLLAAKEEVEPTPPAEREFLLSLVDDDLALTIKDRLQAPTYWDFNFTEEQVRGWFHAVGMTDVRRLTRYPTGYRNLRRFLSPLYRDYADPAAQLFFGEGYVQMIGRKPETDATTP